MNRNTEIFSSMHLPSNALVPNFLQCSFSRCTCAAVVIIATARVAHGCIFPLLAQFAADAMLCLWIGTRSLKVTLRFTPELLSAGILRCCHLRSFHMDRMRCLKCYATRKPRMRRQANLALNMSGGDLTRLSALWQTVTKFRNSVYKDLNYKMVRNVRTAHMQGKKSKTRTMLTYANSTATKYTRTQSKHTLYF